MFYLIFLTFQGISAQYYNGYPGKWIGLLHVQVSYFNTFDVYRDFMNGL